MTELWETARYNLKPRFLRIPGVARVDLVGGRTPGVPRGRRSAAAAGGEPQPGPGHARRLPKNNSIAPTGMHEENHTLYLAVVDGRLRTIGDIENLIVADRGGHPVRIRDYRRGRARAGAGLQHRHGRRA